MKRFMVIAVAIIVAAAFSGCAGSASTPDFSTFQKDNGVIKPAVIFGKKAKAFDGPKLEFTAPKPLAVDNEGNIYTAGKAFEFSKFTADGKYVSIVGVKGKEAGQWNYPKGIATAKNGDVYLADSYNVRLMVYDKNGKLLKEFGEQGDAVHQLSDIGPCSVDADGNFYVADEGAIPGIKKFGPDGKFVSLFAPQVEEGTPGIKVLSWSAIDDELGRLYAGDDGEGDIDVFDLKTGKYLFSFGGHGLEEGQFSEDLSGIAVGPYNLVFVADESDGTIQVYTPEGKFVTQWGKAGIYDGEMAAVEGIGYDPKNNRIVIADEGNFRIQSFALKDIGF